MQKGTSKMHDAVDQLNTLVRQELRQVLQGTVGGCILKACECGGGGTRIKWVWN